MTRPLSEPPYSYSCELCARGELWYTPDGGTARFCHPHSRIIRNAPGWSRVNSDTQNRKSR